MDFRNLIESAKESAAAVKIRALSVVRRLADARRRVADFQARAFANLQTRIACERGQGTTEYAILVGVLVVIAILAITVFRPKLEELWEAISSGIQSL